MGRKLGLCRAAGSLSAASMNRTLCKALIRLAPDNLTFVEIPIRDLPLYNRDFDADFPPVGRALKDAIAAVTRCGSSLPSTTAVYPPA
jgi:NAD(P)H-dependent FMN reductase